MEAIKGSSVSRAADPMLLASVVAALAVASAYSTPAAGWFALGGLAGFSLSTSL